MAVPDPLPRPHVTMSVSTVSSTSCGGNSAERAFSITGDASPAPATARLRGSALTPIPPRRSAPPQASVPESSGFMFPGGGAGRRKWEEPVRKVRVHFRFR